MQEASKSIDLATLSQTYYYVAGITLIVRSGNERTNEMKGGRGFTGGWWLGWRSTAAAAATVVVVVELSAETEI